MQTIVGSTVVNVEFCIWTLLLQEYLLVIVGPTGLYGFLVFLDEGVETLHCILQIQTQSWKSGDYSQQKCHPLCNIIAPRAEILRKDPRKEQDKNMGPVVGTFGSPQDSKRKVDAHIANCKKATCGNMFHIDP